MSDEFTLEKLKISERLTIVETEQKIVCSLIKEIHTAIMGTNGTPGLKIDVDRLKQDKKNNDRHWFVIYTGLVGLALKSVWEFFKND